MVTCDIFLVIERNPSLELAMYTAIFSDRLSWRMFVTGIKRKENVVGTVSNLRHQSFSIQ